MKFSILIANYNNASFIEEAINSAINQTYKNIEIVICDDASTDNSIEIINKLMLKDPKIKLIINSTNLGIGSTKKRLIDNSSGYYFGFLDPDDFLDISAIEILIAEYAKSPFNSIIYSNLINVFPDGRRIISNFNCHIPQNTNFLEFGKGISAFAAINRSLYDLTEGMNPNLRIAEDQDLYLKLEEVGAVRFLDLPLYYYRNHFNSISLYTNVTRAHVWQSIIRYEAYLRRRIPIDEVKLIGYFKNKEMKFQEFYNKMYTVNGSFIQLLKALKKWIFQ